MDVKEIIKSRARGLGEKVFISPNIPADKMKGAIEGITGGAASESSVVAVLDITLFGACDDGVVFTTDSMYYKPFLSDGYRIAYGGIENVEVQGLVSKSLIVHWVGGGESKYEVDDYKADVAASILNTIAQARREEEEDAARAARDKDEVGNEVKKGKPEFNAALEMLKRNGVILCVVGAILCCFMLFWWGIPAILVGLELIAQSKKDGDLYDIGVPVEIYEEDAKELALVAWFGVAIVIGPLAIPSLGNTNRKRIDAIKRIMSDFKVMGEESMINKFLAIMEEKDGKRSRAFVRAYIHNLEDNGELVRLNLDGRPYLFAPDFLENVFEHVEHEATCKERVPRQELIDAVKKDLNADDEVAEAFVNMPENEIEPYTFEDGPHYVHGLHNDKVRVCASCGMAFRVDDESDDEGEYFCSPYCRETEEICREYMKNRSRGAAQEVTIASAGMGGALGNMVSAINDNIRGVAKKSVERIDPDTGVATMVNTGHGVAAEVANNRIDRLMGRSVQHVGNDNSLNGADRIVDGVEIQTKYYRSASASVSSAFTSKGVSGDYKYIGKDGRPMQLEVPRDQYPKAVEIMREKIREGKVPGVTDPADAEKIVRKGHVTYNQSVNMTKCCTIESLLYDAHTGVIVGLSAGGISFAISTALSYYKTKDLKGALRASVAVGLKTGGKAFCVYMLSAQAQRAEFVKAFISNKAININFGGHGKFVERIGRGLDKMSGAKSGSFSSNANRAVKGAVITAVATFAVTSAWEIGKMCRGRMSGMQCIKNIAIAGGGISGGTAGALICGALLAPIPGGVFLGGLLGGSLGGLIGSSATKAGMDKLIKDDAVLVLAIVTDEFKLIASGFCLNDEEIQKATAALDKMINQNKGFVEDIYSKKEYRRHYVARLIKPIFLDICMNRPKLSAKELSRESIEGAVIDV